MPNFCTKCRTQLVQTKIERWDPYTGIESESIIKRVCPQDQSENGHSSWQLMHKGKSQETWLPLDFI